MNQDIATFLKTCVNILEIEKPVVLVFNTKTKKHTDYAAWCWPYTKKSKITKHKVVINLDIVENCNYNLLGVIAHELVHCSMIERGTINWNYHHNKKFQKMAKFLQEYLLTLGIDVGEIYSPHTDTD